MANPTHDISELRRRMQGAIQLLKQELGGLRTGRASASLLEPVQVEAYGTHMPLNQVATVTVPEPRLLSVQVWDRSLVHAVEKGIAAANLGLTPNTEGQTIRLRIPAVNEERRKEVAKVAQKYAEAPRVEGQRRGVEALRKTVQAAGELGIGCLTIFSFSSENWQRPPSEVRDLMSLLRLFIRKDLAELHGNGVRVRIIGERGNLDPDI